MIDELLFSEVLEGGINGAVVSGPEVLANSEKPLREVVAAAGLRLEPRHQDEMKGEGLHDVDSDIICNQQ